MCSTCTGSAEHHNKTVRTTCTKKLLNDLNKKRKTGAAGLTDTNQSKSRRLDDTDATDTNPDANPDAGIHADADGNDEKPEADANEQGKLKEANAKKRKQ